MLTMSSIKSSMLAMMQIASHSLSNAFVLVLVLVAAHPFPVSIPPKSMMNCITQCIKCISRSLPWFWLHHNVS